MPQNKMCRVTLEKSKTMKYHRQTKSDHKNQKKLEKTTQKDYHSDITNPGLKKSGKYKKENIQIMHGKNKITYKISTGKWVWQHDHSTK